MNIELFLLILHALYSNMFTCLR